MLAHFLKITTIVALAFVFNAAPLSFDLTTKDAYADSHKNKAEKGEKSKKEKKSKKDKADKDCSRDDQNCNDANENRKSEGKSKKGGKSDEMKAKGKKS